MSLSALVIAALLALQPAAQGPAAPGPQARAGDLHVLQLWADDQDRFIEQWAQPTPPYLTTTNRTERNRTIFQFVIFTGCRPDARGNCNLVGSIEVLDPDGEPYGNHTDIKFWDGEPGPTAPHMALSPSGIGLVIEDGEKLGDYRIRLAVTDANAGVTARS